MTAGWLHVYSPFTWHSSADIVGDRAGIEKLRDALNAALAHDNGVAMATGVFVNDGEGYPMNVYVVTPEEMRHMVVPYTDDMARDDCGMWPHQLPKQPQWPEGGAGK